MEDPLNFGVVRPPFGPFPRSERKKKKHAARLMIGHFCSIHTIDGLGRMVSRMRAWLASLLSKINYRTRRLGLWCSTTFYALPAWFLSILPYILFIHICPQHCEKNLMQGCEKLRVKSWFPLGTPIVPKTEPDAHPEIFRSAGFPRCFTQPYFTWLVGSNW